MKTTPLTETEMLAHCGRAIRKIDRGARGVEQVTHEEITAMAALIVGIDAGALCLETAEAVDRLSEQKGK